MSKPVIPTNAFAAGNSCFTNSRVQKLKNSAKPNSGTVRRSFMEESWFGFLIAGGLCSKPGRSLCERIKLTFATAPGCLHSLSLGRHDRFCGCLPVSLLECFLVFGTRRAVSGFGLGLLVSSGFLGAKAGFGGFGL